MNVSFIVLLTLKSLYYRKSTGIWDTFDSTAVGVQNNEKAVCLTWCCHEEPIVLLKTHESLGDHLWMLSLRPYGR